MKEMALQNVEIFIVTTLAQSLDGLETLVFILSLGPFCPLASRKKEDMLGWSEMPQGPTRYI